MMENSVNKTKKQEVYVRQPHQSYLILNNVAKDSNFGFLIRTANAMGAVPVIVGRRRYSRGGAAGGTRRTPVSNFLRMSDAVAAMREAGCDLCGIEIMPQAKSAIDKPFRKSTAFIVGNEGEGLTDSLKSWCDYFVYVPQYGTAVSLNINVAAGIVLHQYAVWAGFKESPRLGEKFQRSGEQEIDAGGR